MAIALRLYLLLAEPWQFALQRSRSHCEVQPWGQHRSVVHSSTLTSAELAPGAHPRRVHVAKCNATSQGCLPPLKACLLTWVASCPPRGSCFCAVSQSCSGPTRCLLSRGAHHALLLVDLVLVLYCRVAVARAALHGRLVQRTTASGVARAIRNMAPRFLLCGRVRACKGLL